MDRRISNKLQRLFRMPAVRRAMQGNRVIARPQDVRGLTRSQRGSFGQTPSPVCPIHRCHMKYIGRGFHPAFGKVVPTWGCPVPGCGQQVSRVAP